jgi:hypothetical protein
MPGSPVALFFLVLSEHLVGNFFFQLSIQVPGFQTLVEGLFSATNFLPPAQSQTVFGTMLFCLLVFCGA